MHTMHIYIYIYTHTHAYMHIHICIHILLYYLSLLEHGNDDDRAGASRPLAAASGSPCPLQRGRRCGGLRGRSGRSGGSVDVASLTGDYGQRKPLN